MRVDNCPLASRDRRLKLSRVAGWTAEQGKRRVSQYSARKVSRADGRQGSAALGAPARSPVREKSRALMALTDEVAGVSCVTAFALFGRLTAGCSCSTFMRTRDVHMNGVCFSRKKVLTCCARLYFKRKSLTFSQHYVTLNVW